FLALFGSSISADVVFTLLLSPTTTSALTYHIRNDLVVYVDSGTIATKCGVDPPSSTPIQSSNISPRPCTSTNARPYTARANKKPQLHMRFKRRVEASRFWKRADHSTRRRRTDRPSTTRTREEGFALSLWSFFNFTHLGKQ
ncbi:hypothetical protein PanWU01x14_323530, partial [Parasponia andersonii]